MRQEDVTTVALDLVAGGRLDGNINLVHLDADAEIGPHTTLPSTW